MNELELFICYLEEQVKNHSIYVWGAQGQKGAAITEAWIKSRETSTANANRAINYWKKQVALGHGEVLRAFDCSGLAMYYLQNLKGIYKSDMTANSLMGKCTKITRGELKKGDWVFRVDSGGKATHIGYVVDDTLNVIEAKGRDDGVVKRHVDYERNYWDTFARPGVFNEYIKVQAPLKLSLCSPLMRGESIKLLQQSLNGLGYSCGEADGICGKNTLAGISAFAAAQSGGEA